MLSDYFHLDAKSISRLSTKGLSLDALKEQIDENVKTTLEIWHSQGLELTKHLGYYFFATKFTSLENAEFCIVDIETNGSKIDKHQIIEIAALKIKNGKIIGKFESLVKCDTINKHITEITGISVKDTHNAPKLKNVLFDFRTFLADSIFVAHDVKFDYKFISGSLEKVGLPPLLNRSLCSIALAERSVVSYRYALSYLNDFYSLNPNATHHRAMSDVVTTYALFMLSLQNIDANINNVEDLIKFSKEAKRLKRPKFDPLAKVEEEEEQETQD